MTTEIAIRQGLTHEQVDLIKRTICRGSTDDELALFVQQCQRTGLDPFTRQIHAVKRWDSNQRREVMTIQTGIDGYRLVAERTGKYAGNDDPVYDTEEAEHPNKATVTVWKIVDGQRVAFTRSARWKEFVQTKKDGSVTRFWSQMPYLMLGKVAEALALRAAFPQELSGIYTHEEMGQADNERDAPVVNRPAIAAKPQDDEHDRLFAELKGVLTQIAEAEDQAEYVIYDILAGAMNVNSLNDLPTNRLSDAIKAAQKRLARWKQQQKVPEPAAVAATTETAPAAVSGEEIPW